MRVAVVGATGHVGTAVLVALGGRREVTSVRGIARRAPDGTVPPYDGAEWVPLDIGAAVDPEATVTRLTEAFTGVDAVIHLVWLSRPAGRRDLLRRVNVEGTRHVARAVAAAGVRTLVVVSSASVHAPSPRGAIREKAWPRTGIRTAHDGVDAVAQDEVLDQLEAEHPSLSVARLRPAPIVAGGPGAGIPQRMQGVSEPLRLLASWRSPALPLPRGLRVQAVHVQDLAEACVTAAVLGARGAFDLCADDVLDGPRIARVLGRGPRPELPVPVVRTAVVAGHRAGLIASGEGWLDLLTSAPLRDAARARDVLGWHPRHRAEDTLREALEALQAEDDGAGHRLPASIRDAGRPAEGAEIAPRIDRGLLQLYLSDHLTGATAGAARIRRMAEDYVDTPVFSVVASVAEEIRAERRILRQVIRDLGLRPLRHRQAVAALGERAGRLKGNGRVLSRSPMTLLLETELMRSAVLGKRGGWQTLAENAPDLGLDATVFHDLAATALRQYEDLDRVHRYARERAFRRDREVYPSDAPGSAGP